MIFRVYTPSGVGYMLPAALSWRITQTGGVPCDSIEVTSLWDGEDCNPLQWQKIEAVEGEKTVFRGLVDECVSSISDAGMTLGVSGRGMAALLLDNEAVGCDYQLATVDDIIGNHITPYGIAVGGVANFPAVSQFSVTTGRSEWSVVEDFCSRYGGIAPWFDSNGTLWLTERSGENVLSIDGHSAVTALECRHRRYGVLSEVLLRSRDELREISVKNNAMVSLGGRCRRVMTLLKGTSTATGQADGQFLLDESAEKLVELSVTVGEMLFDVAGSNIQLVDAHWPFNGQYRVREAVVSFGKKGYQTTLTLGKPV